MAKDSDDIDARHAELQRREDRGAAIERLHEQAQAGTFDKAGRYAWDRMAADQQQDFLETKSLPKGWDNHHFESLAANQDQMGHGPLPGVLTDHNDHIQGWHDNNTQAPTFSDEPKNPNWEETWGRQEADATTPSGRDALGFTDGNYEQKLDDQLLKDYPELAAQMQAQQDVPAQFSAEPVGQQVDATDAASLMSDQGATVGLPDSPAETFATDIGAVDNAEVACAVAETRDTSGPAVDNGDSFSVPADSGEAASPPGDTGIAVNTPAYSGDSLGAPVNTDDSFGAPAESVNSPRIQTDTEDSFSAPVEIADSFSASVETSDSFSAPVESADSCSVQSNTEDSFSAAVESGDSFGGATESGDSFSPSIDAGGSFSDSGTTNDSFSALADTGTTPSAPPDGGSCSGDATGE